MLRDLGQESQGSSVDLSALGGLLDRFMVGQVPIRARILSASVTSTTGLTQLVASSDDPPVYLVASTDADQYWIDTRRLLYDGQVFEVLARVKKDGPTTRWTAVKLLDLLRSFAPGLGDQFDQLERQLNSAGTGVLPDGTREALEAVFVEYGLSLGEIDHDTLTDTARLVSGFVADSGTGATEMRSSFKAIDRLAKENSVVLPAKADRLSTQRRVRETHGVDVFGKIATGSSENASDFTDQFFVEAEVVAIYW